MPLTLTIENQTSLPDGGPLSLRLTGRRGADIGRDQHLDWTLPDPTRVISGKHCEVRWQDGAYWLYDVSTNGTFVNRADRRMQAPHRLKNGDRIEIGNYILAVALDGEEAAAAGAAPGLATANPADPWAPTEPAAPPMSPRDLQNRERRPVNADFLDWAMDAPGGAAPPRPAGPAAPPPTDDRAWAGVPPPPPLPEPPPPLPTPRRPPAVAPDVWGAPPAAAAPPAAENPWGTPSLARPLAGPAAPPPPPAMAPAPAPAAPPAAAPIGDDGFVRRLAAGAGVAPEIFAQRDPGALAEELGALLRLVAVELKQLLAARAESKRAARSTSQTMIQALDNNPLKFSPTVEDALRAMFAPSSSGYLDSRRTFEQSFRDLKLHQVKTYSAMQHALRMLVEDLDPEAIAKASDGGGGLGGMVGSRKARQWDAYLARWQAMSAPHEDGILGAFMLFFAEAYDRGGGR